jgi:hypothetical protein
MKRIIKILIVYQYPNSDGAGISRSCSRLLEKVRAVFRFAKQYRKDYNMVLMVHT